MIAWSIAGIAAASGWIAAWVLRRSRIARYERPIAYFRRSLEDLREGFITDEMPEAPFRKAAPEVRACYEEFLEVNRSTIRQMANLEQGYEEERRAKLAQAALTAAYEKYVPKQFLRHLGRPAITEVKLGDHVQADMTILFSDIRAFTSLSESISPEDNFRLLNAYLAQMEPHVQQYGGFVDKYIGDAIMALFDRSPDDALMAALAMLRSLDDYNDGRRKAGYAPIEIGIALNTGSMMLGIVGGPNRMEGTVISDIVNTCSRLEDLNKEYGTRLLIAESTYAGLAAPSRYELRMLDRVQVKGRRRPVTIYEAFGSEPEHVRTFKLETKLDYETGVGHYYAEEYAAALSCFENCLARAEDDRAAQLFYDRIRRKEA